MVLIESGKDPVAVIANKKMPTIQAKDVSLRQIINAIMIQINET